ncbi:MAG: hypothetical protein WA919_28415 [Coleofasciculaceae cyanobacterium]
MTQLPPDDKQGWQEFLRQNRPLPPTEAEQSEEKLLKAIEKSSPAAVSRRVWAVSPAIAAGLLMVWSSHRSLTLSPDSRLEAFLENNWSRVVGETAASSQSNNLEEDWMILATGAR